MAAAGRGELPRLVQREDLRGFLHCHTTYSDGSTTVEELALACRAAGYEYLGVTDHSQAAAYAGGLSAGRPRAPGGGDRRGQRPADGFPGAQGDRGRHPAGWADRLR